MQNRHPLWFRSGAAAVEAAIVIPILILLLLGLILGGMGVFHSQQTACLAQEIARYASTHGSDYQKDTNQKSPTQDQIINAVALPLAVSMDASQLSFSIQWINQGANDIQDWDGSPKNVKSLTPNGEYVTNTLRVTVTYNWVPGSFIGANTLTSVCEVPMSN